ncbi:hypothetical protein F4819DRAFT_430556 [Hypoxylon fuscum]|nr:hypothetical protein F4819DRAFT_430556 [Hypoxylon fuscum]
MSLGPLTTSFTPPADCTASSALYWINTANTFYFLHGSPGQSSCFPDNYSPYQNQYYSPGICPAGYTRACESLSTSASHTATQAVCCPIGNYICASTSSSYSYPWGPTLGCMSVYLVDTATHFTTLIDTLEGTETAGDLTSLKAPGTIMAYGIRIQNSQTTTTDGAATTTTTSGSASDSLQTSSSAIASATGEAQQDSSSSGLSTGAAAGIGVGVAIGIMALGGIILWMFWSRRRKRQAAAERERAAMIPGSEDWSSSTWTTTTPMPYQRPAVQVNWQPTELAQEGEPREMSADSRMPAEKDGRAVYWRPS